MLSRLNTPPSLQDPSPAFPPITGLRTQKARRNQARNIVLIMGGETVCPQTTEGNHKGVTDQRKTSTGYLLSLSELSLVLRCLWRFILTHPTERNRVGGDHQKRTGPDSQDPAPQRQEYPKRRAGGCETAAASALQPLGEQSCSTARRGCKTQLTCKGRKTKPKMKQKADVKGE